MITLLLHRILSMYDIFVLELFITGKLKRETYKAFLTTI